MRCACSRITTGLPGPAGPDRCHELADDLAASMARRRFTMNLLTSFAGITLSLTAIGLRGPGLFGLATQPRDWGLGLRAWGCEGWLRLRPASSRTPAWRCKMAIRSYRDLEVWRLSMDLLIEVYQLSSRLPRTSDSHSENRCEGHPFRSPRILRKASGGAPVANMRAS